MSTLLTRLYENVVNYRVTSLVKIHYSSRKGKVQYRASSRKGKVQYRATLNDVETNEEAIVPSFR